MVSHSYEKIQTTMACVTHLVEHEDVEGPHQADEQLYTPAHTTTTVLQPCQPSLKFIKVSR
jgi:hypothetical protein